MKKQYRRIISFFMMLIMCLGTGLSVFAENEQNDAAEYHGTESIPTSGSEDYTGADTQEFTVSAKAAYLCEATSGRIIFSQNEDEHLIPASVTKVMTLLLVMEAIEAGNLSLDTKVSVSAYAASMGGSQVFLKEGEELTLEEMLKCAVIASANDASVALAEFIAGSENAFVARMNERAKELGMENTNFENVTGLDDTTENHYTSAEDIAIMSRELLKHKKITEYSSLWQDSIRDGQFVLTNTNRLVRFYSGCDGLKTGSTAKAGYCVSATAERDGMRLIAVVMGADTRDERNKIARELLDYGFSGYALYTSPESSGGSVAVRGGVKDCCLLIKNGFSVVVPRADKDKVEVKYTVDEYVTSPVKKGDRLGKAEYFIGETKLGESDIVAAEDVLRMEFSEMWLRMLRRVISGK